MDYKQTHSFMLESGFKITDQRGGKTFWHDGQTRIMTFDKCHKDDKQAEYNLKQAVRRAISIRPQAPIKIPESMKQDAPVTRKIIVPRDPKLTATLGAMAQSPDTQPVQRVIAPPAKEPVKICGRLTWDPIDREVLMLRIKELFDERYTHKEMTDKLNQEGFRNAQGDPIKSSLVVEFCHKMGLRHFASMKDRKKAAREEKKVISRMLTLPTVPASMPIPKEPMPPSSVKYEEPPSMAAVRDILRDDKISPEKRIKIALAYLE